MRQQVGHGRSILLVIICLLVLIVPVSGQEKPEVTHSAKTTSDVLIEVSHLQVLLRPLTQDELEIELAVWLSLLRAKITEVGEVELQLAALAEGESSKTLTEQMIALRNEQAQLTERTRVVLDALEYKGGEVQSAKQFIIAVSDISETTDTTSFVAAILAEVKSWAARDDGGKAFIRRAILALVILLISWLLSKIAGRTAGRVLAKHPRASSLLENFARKTAGGVVLVIGIMMTLGTLGVPLGPLMAALGGGGFIVGFALQETLGNFASGMLIMVYRPFDLDDYVNVAGVEGTVKQMSLVSTTLATVDNKLLIIPNKSAWGQTITNFTGCDVRRVDLVFGIGYDDNIDQVINILKEIATQHQLVLDDPVVTVHVDELADSSVNLFCRPWVKTADYWTVHWDLTRQVKERFDAEGICIPYPQRDVHVQSDMKQS